MAKCAFCGNDLMPGTGFLFVKRDGTALFFCSRKCEKNLLLLKRKPASFKWTAASRSLRKPAEEKKRKEKPVEEKKERKKKGKKKRTRRKKKKK